MHETALAAQLLRQIEQEAEAVGASRVTEVRLQVGELAGVEPVLLEEAFRRLAPNTQAAGARLELVLVPLAATCESCGRSFQVERFRFQCPVCGGVRTRVIAGEELVLESLVVVTERNSSEALVP
jgi:hydrogenase nickel incorporation protein HypA/HybF